MFQFVVSCQALQGHTESPVCLWLLHRAVLWLRPCHTFSGGLIPLPCKQKSWTMEKLLVAAVLTWATSKCLMDGSTTTEDRARVCQESEATERQKRGQPHVVITRYRTKTTVKGTSMASVRFPLRDLMSLSFLLRDTMPLYLYSVTT